MHHNRSMSECFDRPDRVVDVRPDGDTLMDKLFLFANPDKPRDPDNVPMRERNLPRSFFQPNWPQDSNRVMTGFARKVSVSHVRNISFDSQGLNWRNTGTATNSTNQQTATNNNRIDNRNNYIKNETNVAVRPVIERNTNGAPQNGAPIGSTCLLDLDLEADMARMRQNREDFDRIRSSMFNANQQPPTNESAPAEAVHASGQNDYRSPCNSTNQLTYLSSASASGSGSILDSESSPSLNTTVDLMTKPQLPYHHLRQTSVDSGLGLYPSTGSNFARKWHTNGVHHGHTHSMNIIPGYDPGTRTLNIQSNNSVNKSAASLHNSRSSIAGSGTISQPNEIIHDDMDPMNIIPTLPDLTSFLSIDDIMSTINDE